MTFWLDRIRLASAWHVWLLLLVAAGAFVFRCNRLDLRPVHTDEAVHAAKIGILLDTGVYEYDYREYHGPVAYYPAVLMLRAMGVSRYADIPNIAPLRLVTVFFGIGLILLPLLFADALGRLGAAAAGILAAVSPGLTYYSRYFIQEVPFTFCSFLMLAAAWRYTRQPRLGWALVGGIAAGLMQAGKETSVVVWCCMFVASGLIAWHHWGTAAFGGILTHRPLWHAGAAALAGILTATALLSNFYRNPAAIWDALRAYEVYLGRASTGDGHGVGPAAHIHPWYYYIKLLIYFRNGAGRWWSEGFIVVLALIGSWAAWRGNAGGRRLPRVISLLALGLLLLFSFVPYKTPWNMLGFLYALVLLAGYGFARMMTWKRHFAYIIPLALVSGAGVWHLAQQTHAGTFRYHADPRNPYVYGHTSTDLRRLVERVEQLSEVHPDKRGMPIQVIASDSDYWPLPWEFRRFKNAGFYDTLPEHISAPVVIVSPSLSGSMTARENKPWHDEYFGLRPELLLQLKTEPALWDRFSQKLAETSP